MLMLWFSCPLVDGAGDAYRSCVVHSLCAIRGRGPSVATAAFAGSLFSILSVPTGRRRVVSVFCNLVPRINRDSINIYICINIYKYHVMCVCVCVCHTMSLPFY